MKPSISLVTLGTALLATLVLTGCATAGGKTTAQVKTEKRLIRLDHLTDTAEPADRKKSEAVGMSCAKCRTVTLKPPSVQLPTRQLTSYRSWGTAFDDNSRQFSRGGVFENAGPVHYCPGCKSTITTAGSGKERKETVQHTCSLQHGASTSCCATHRDV